MLDVQTRPALPLGCGHELYPGEEAVLADGPEGGTWLCPDCFRDWLRAQGAPALARRLLLPVWRLEERRNARCQTASSRRAASPANGWQNSGISSSASGSG